jgi:hypothetical protein
MRVAVAVAVAVPVAVAVETAVCVAVAVDTLDDQALAGVKLADFGIAKKTAAGHRGTASLDRIDSTLGYVTGNVQWVHKSVNHMKSDTPEEEFVEWCRRIVAHSDSVKSLP